MKNKNMIILLIAGLLLALSLSITAFAESTAGTSADPVVTKSYVDAQIESLKAQLKSGDSDNASASSGVSAPAAFTPVHVEEGQSLIGGEGTELVVRSGEALAIDNGADGVSDLTSAKDLKGGTKVGLNHLLLVPRNDGRGLKCASACWIMVKGSYTIQ